MRMESLDFKPYVGKVGRAVLSNSVLEPDTAVVGQWLIRVKKAHPIWEHWLVSMIHLRPHRKQTPPIKFFEEATHEFTLIALDSYQTPKPNMKTSWAILTPLNYEAQIDLSPPPDNRFGDLYDMDGTAHGVCEQMARRAVEGFYFLEPQGVVGAKQQVKDLLSNFVMPPCKVFMRGLDDV